MPKEKIFSQLRPAISRSDLWLWGLLIVGNLLLFVPNWLFLQPENISLNLEWNLVLSIGLWAAVQVKSKSWRKLFWGLVTLFFYVAIVYKSYAAVLLGVYRMEPNFTNDLPFIANGLPFLLDALDISVFYYIGFVVGVLGLFAFVGYAAYVLLVRRVDTLGRTSALAVLLWGGALLFYSGVRLGFYAELPTGINSLSSEIKQNLSASRASRQNVGELLAQNPYQVYDYAQYSLAEKPNVYMIFVESYGSVLYTREHFSEGYLPLAEALEADLKADGWQSVSALSTAPTWGGGSWMSYTSTLFGINVGEQSEYLALRDAYQKVPYPNMGRYFHSQGYEFVWTVPINRQLPPKVEAADHAFYGADRWITYDTLDYGGPLYGWGPSPPDQYTLGFISQDVAATPEPVFLVFLTQDSHYPWVPLPTRVENWQDLSTSNLAGGSLNEEEKDSVSVFQARENYAAAIAHSFENLDEFITTLDDPNAVIVLLGDHQPPTVSRHEDGFTTMLHIISRDADFLAEFEPFGFEEGLVLSEPEARLAHEGFYSLFVRNFLARYGEQPNNLPPYLAQGLH